MIKAYWGQGNNLRIDTNQLIDIMHRGYDNNLEIIVFDLALADIETLITCLSQKRRELVEAQGLVPAEDAEALDS